MVIFVIVLRFQLSSKHILVNSKGKISKKFFSDLKNLNKKIKVNAYFWYFLVYNFEFRNLS